MIRDDQQDLIYKIEDAKWNAVLEDIADRHEQGQPILVGTVSIEKSEKLSTLLNRRGIEHHVLNAKNHEKEAMIVAQAGRLGAVTVATNMAGRGVDILLGGNPEYLARQEMAAREWDNDAYLLFEMEPEERAEYEAEYEPIYRKLKQQTDAEHDEVVGVGGLYVLGTERHESRRIDNQLRGRAGRQGDPGASLFYLSLEDDLMRMFASDRIGSIMERLKWPEEEAITAKMVTKAVEGAQRQIEELNFERRKNVLKYDDVMNTQRQVIYEEREKLLSGEDFKDQAIRMVEEVVARNVQRLAPEEVFNEEWDHELVLTGITEVFPTSISGEDLEEMVSSAELSERAVDDALERYEEKEQALGSQTMRELERLVLLNITDTRWREHLYEMDYLQEGIHLRAYAQKDPLTEYRREAYLMFEELTESIQDDFVKYIYRVELVRQDEPGRPRPQRVQTQHGDEDQGEAAGSQAKSGKVPRNAPCPCGSGKKYKKCHGAVA
jgi:preprotein translocase subunit SecA